MYIFLKQDPCILSSTTHLHLRLQSCGTVIRETGSRFCSLVHVPNVESCRIRHFALQYTYNLENKLKFGVFFLLFPGKQEP
jgi:hypothetical protein